MMDRDKLIEQAIEYRARWDADDTDFRNGYELAADFAIEYAAEQVRAERVEIAGKIKMYVANSKIMDTGTTKSFLNLVDQLRGEE